MTETLRAYHGEEGLKEMFLARVLLHREADRLVQGRGWDKGTDGVFRGCAVGCVLEAYDHSRYPIELGIPEVLARLEDRIFEGLPRAEAMLWPERFLDAPKPGADLSGVWPLFADWLLADPKHGVIRFAQTDEQRAIIGEIAGMWRDRVPLRDPRWRDARDRAYEVRRKADAADAAYAAADAAYAAYADAAADAADAAYAAYAAAYAAADAADAAYAAYADAAAYAAAYAAYAADARKKHWIACADKLVELMSAAPVIEAAA